ncbi:MAG: C39 family peptidase [Anaerolineales bacterium]
MRAKRIFVTLGSLLVVGLLLLQIPAIKDRALWGYIQADAYLRGVIHPAGQIPTPLPTSTPSGSEQPTTQAAATLTPTAVPSPEPEEATQVPTPAPTALPDRVYLDPPNWEQQDINGCGPATLSMYLHYYGWEGNQYSIDKVIKPDSADRNVNVEELAYFTWNYAGWLNLIYRVGGEIETVKTLIANGIPVMIEEGDELAQQYWPDDDKWAGHFLLLTGYDDSQGVFYAQDSFRQADRLVSYEKTDQRWKPFNRVYILIFLPHQEQLVKDILGENWDIQTNRQNALEAAQAEIDLDPADAMAWFNLGSNLTYFERYPEAAEAYDHARILGLPQRMLRYQFGPFHAYFQTQRYDDLLALTEHTLQVTPNSEEAFLWKGWALYSLGNSTGAIEAFKKSYESNPTSHDAQYALDFMGATP